MTSNATQIPAAHVALSTSSEVVARLMDLMDQGAILPGQSLPPERDLAKQLSVSRTTVREAIHELSLKGILRRRQGSGTVMLGASEHAVALMNEMSQSERDMKETVDLRLVFEPKIAAFAALRRTESDILHMERFCDYDPAEATPEQSLELDQRFHEAVARATHNQLIFSMTQVVSGWLTEFRSKSHSTPESRSVSHQGHSAILQAIRDGEDALAAELMFNHIDEVGLY